MIILKKWISESVLVFRDWAKARTARTNII